jgi:pimeloyl-ACP methyl ester carboxylesterase
MRSPSIGQCFEAVTRNRSVWYTRLRGLFSSLLCLVALPAVCATTSLAQSANGLLGTATLYGSGGSSPAHFVVVRDVNGDGKPDLLVAVACADSTCANGGVSILLGNGDGTFQSAVTYGSGGVQPLSLAVEDVNGDGRLDVVVANVCTAICAPPSPGSVAVLLGNGDGTFQPAVPYGAGGLNALSVAVRDVNGDGKLDLLVGNGSDFGSSVNGGVSVLLGNGDGTFQPAKTYGSGGGAVYAVAGVDVNGDGKVDVVATTFDSNTVSVLLGNGDGTFQTAASYGSGGAYSHSVAVGDVNGDGKADLVVANFCIALGNCANGTVGVLLGNGDGTFQTAVPYGSGGGEASAVVLADVDGDGKLDVVVANLCAISASSCANGTVAVLLGNGDGTFQSAVTYGSGGSQATSVTVADVNGDGKPDVLVANGSSVGVLLNIGSFPPAPVLIDTTTSYGLGIEPGSAPCIGTCDLSPPYNHYVVAAPFNISKITFNWKNTGGNNCDGLGNYGGIISATNNAAGTLATSNNNAYLGCAGFSPGGTSGTGELDFSGQTIPASFYLDFATVDGEVQGGASINVYNVEIWATQSAQPGPVLQSVQPTILTQATTVPSFTITGTGFQPNSVIFLGSDISVSALALNAQGQLTATLNISPAATLGCHDVTVTSQPGGQSSTLSCGVFVVNSVPPAPDFLQVVVGNNEVLLRWASVLTFPPVTSYLISVDAFNPQTQTFSSYGSASVSSAQTSAMLTVLDNGNPLQNGVIYRFTVAGILSPGVNGESAQPVAGMPNSFQVSAISPPQHPILFIHGITSQAANTYWNSATNFLSQSLSWKFGGVLSAVQNSNPATATLTGPQATSPGDFYTVLFSDSLANTGGIERQGDEVGAFLGYLQTEFGSFPKASLFAHSMGGLASRAYLQTSANAGNEVSELITYGTPHLGVLADDLQNQYNEMLNASGPRAYLAAFFILPQLNQHGITSNIFNSVGFAEMNSSCTPSGSQFQPSQFLSALNTSTSGYAQLPANVSYKFLAGQYQPPSPFGVLNDSQGEFFGSRNAPCSMFEDNPPTNEAISTDGIVPLKSADPSLALPTAFASVTSTQLFELHTAKPHWEETEDIPTILCALSANCMVAEAHSPVDLLIIQPDGAEISPNMTQIPSAGYDVVHDSPQHDIAVVTIPIPMAGVYTIGSEQEFVEAQ